jgi:PiT family inorganic phosphate transporter
MAEIIIVIVILTILFELSNGWNDSANSIATVVSTRVLSPLQAVIMAASINMIGAFYSTAVARTIGEGIVSPGAITNSVVIVTLIVGFSWNTTLTRIGLPTSASHALIGALIGASIAHGGGTGILNLWGITKIFLALLTSPVIGLVIGYLLMRLLLALFGRFAHGTINKVIGRIQLLSSAAVAFSHGSNDAQKGMGIITLALVSGGFIDSLQVPAWVIVICALAIGTGTAIGGWRIIKTVGISLMKLEPVHGFAAETSAAITILTFSHLGLPVSTTHVLSTSVMGIGATRRLTAVRWGIAGKIVMAWVFTLPICIAAGWLITTIVQLFWKA